VLVGVAQGDGLAALTLSAPPANCTKARTLLYGFLQP
jgi:hypothetical protein